MTPEELLERFVSHVEGIIAHWRERAIMAEMRLEQAEMLIDALEGVIKAAAIREGNA